MLRSHCVGENASLTNTTWKVFVKIAPVCFECLPTTNRRTETYGKWSPEWLVWPKCIRHIQLRYKWGIRLEKKPTPFTFQDHNTYPCFDPIIAQVDRKSKPTLKPCPTTDHAAYSFSRANLYTVRSIFPGKNLQESLGKIGWLITWRLTPCW